MDHDPTIKILSDMALVAAKHGDLVSAIDYLAACVQELDKRGFQPTSQETSAEFFGRFNLHPEFGC